MNIAIIPARGGSKRIPRKNIKSFAGQPIIGYSITAAIQTGLFDHVIISTDDEEIATVAEEYGAKAPFRRPLELADDFAPLLPVVCHAIEWVHTNLGSVDHACCILPTAPLIRNTDLAEGYQYLASDPAVDFVLSATEYRFPIFRALKVGEDGYAGLIWPENDMVRSQDLPQACHDAGQFYWASRDTWLSATGILSSRNRLVLLPRKLVQDIDSPEDWEEAELLYELIQKKRG